MLTFSLANCSLSSNIIDISFNLFFDFIINGDYTNVHELSKFLPELAAYFVASQRTILYADLENCLELFELPYPKSIASEILERYKGDFEITEMLSFLS